jgi:hypothetical protein
MSPLLEGEPIKGGGRPPHVPRGEAGRAKLGHREHVKEKEHT